MKRTHLIFYAVFLILLAGILIRSLQTSKQPSLILNGQTFYLTRAYPSYNATDNIYQTDSSPRQTIRISQKTALQKEEAEADNAVREAMFQMMQSMSKALPDTNRFSSAKDGSSFAFSSVGANNSYRYTRSDQTDKDSTTLTFTGLPLDENFAKTDDAWRAQLDALKIPRVYPVRPGMQKPDDSEELENIKKLLAAPYNPKMQIFKRNNITTYNTVDPNQQQVIQLIASGNEADATAWLKEHLADYSPIYLYAFAKRLASQPAPYRDFLFWYFAANLRGGADVALCKDKYVGQYLTGLKWETADTVQSVYPNEPQDMTPAQAAEWNKSVMREVVQWDKTHPQKNSPDWMCKSGHAVRTDEAYPQEEWEKRRKEFKEKYTASAFKN